MNIGEHTSHENLFFFSRKISYPSKRLAEDVKNHEDVYLENIWENII